MAEELKINCSANFHVPSFLQASKRLTCTSKPFILRPLILFYMLTLKLLKLEKNSKNSQKNQY